jgi:ABC-type phosphate transport system substrate-binding protein
MLRKIIGIAVICGLGFSVHLGMAEDVVFIVNAQNPAKSISKIQLSNFFLKKEREWPDGTSVRFIDRKDGSEARTTFLSQYIGKTGKDVDLYWIGQKLYSGDAAPMQVDSDSSVISLVSSLKGAIGFVSPKSVLGTGVKKIDITGGRTP